MCAADNRPAGWGPDLPPEQRSPDGPPSVGRGAAPLRDRWVAGAVAALGAALVIGPGWKPGGLANVDLLVVPRARWPEVLTGVGPALPRRAPFRVLEWLAAPVSGSALVAKVVMCLLVGVCAAGVCRWSERCVPVGWGWARVWCGVGVGLGPFVLTRLVVGHLGLVWAAAVLAWALPDLFDVDVRWPRVFGWGLALGLGGYLAGTMVPVVALAAVVQRGFRRAPMVVAGLGAGQLVWAVPAFGVGAAGNFGQSGSSAFATWVPGWRGWAQVVAGGGFWDPFAVPGVGRSGAGRGGAAASTLAAAQVPWAMVALGVVLAALLAIGWLGARRSVAGEPSAGVNSGFGSGRMVLVVFGTAFAVASAVPGVRASWESATRTLPFNLFREGQRMWLLAILGMVPWVARGLDRQANGVRPALVGRVGLGVLVLVQGWAAAPFLWGAGGRLDPVVVPDDVRAVVDRVESAPGPVLVLPWLQYGPSRLAAGRRVHTMWPELIDGDVVFSTDPGFDSVDDVQVDPRGRVVNRAVALLRSGDGEGFADTVASSGVRWVVLERSLNFARYGDLGRFGRLRSVVSGSNVELFEVRGWAGVTGPDGTGGSLRRVVPGVGWLLRVRWSGAPSAAGEPGGCCVTFSLPDVGWRLGEGWGPGVGLVAETQAEATQLDSVRRDRRGAPAPPAGAVGGRRTPSGTQPSGRVRSVPGLTPGVVWSWPGALTSATQLGLVLTCAAAWWCARPGRPRRGTAG